MIKIEEAIRIAAKAHEDQLDKTGYPYIFHPLRVMLALHDSNEQIVAVLHDVVEDCGIELTYLQSLGFPKNIVDAIDAISKRDGESYMDYIRRVKKNKLARAVKIADISDNLSPMRQSKLAEDTQKFLKKKYLKGLKKLL